MKYILMPILNIITAILVLFLIAPILIIMTTAWNGKIDKELVNEYKWAFDRQTVKDIFSSEFIMQ